MGGRRSRPAKRQRAPQPVPIGSRVEEHSPKSGKPRRISLPAAGVAELRRWATRQRWQRQIAVDAWTDTGYVFTDPLGQPVTPDSASGTFAQRQRNLDLSRLRFHDLRHTSATLALAAGVPLKVVSERLGHSSVQITADLYMHVTPGMDADAAELIGALVYGPTGT